MTEEHGVSVLYRMLKELDGKTVTVTVPVQSPKHDPDFDRKVRDALDRMHRRKRIAEE